MDLERLHLLLLEYACLLLMVLFTVCYFFVICFQIGLVFSDYAENMHIAWIIVTEAGW